MGNPVIVATFIIIERSCTITILSETTTKLLERRRQEREDILIIRGKRVSKVINVNLTIQGYCAVAIIPIATGRHEWEATGVEETETTMPHILRGLMEAP